MTLSTHLALPYMEAAQAQKHVTHNEALALLDALVMLSVSTRNVTSPPATATEGDRVLVGAGATGAFSGKSGQIAAFLANGWSFLVPQTGWRVYVASDSLMLIYDGSHWIDAGLVLRNLQGLSLLGVGTTATGANPLSAKLNAALFTASSVAEGGSGDLRVTLNKSASANTVSQLYQSNYSGRAETGLAGDDRFRVKVSADGATWRDAITVDPATGKPSFPSGVADGVPFSFRNLLRNPTFVINQRSVAGTVTLAAGAFGHDGVKAGADGATYTFALSGGDVQITVTAGSLILPIEAAMIEGGVYTLSQAGTAQARVWQGTGSTGSGAYAATPFTTPGLTIATQTNVEFSTGTILRPQLELGTVATKFERRLESVEHDYCRRYFYVHNLSGTMGVVAGSTYILFSIPLKIRMRAIPTRTLLKTSFASANYELMINGAWSNASNLTLGAAGFSVEGGVLAINNFSGLTVGQIAIGNQSASLLSLTAEI